MRRVGPLNPPTRSGWPPALPRPARLLKPPQPVEALAMLPDNPPAQFIWRRKRRGSGTQTDPNTSPASGGRPITSAALSATIGGSRTFGRPSVLAWLFRSGDAVDPATGDLRWFLHGFF